MRWSGINGCIHLACHHIRRGTWLIKYTILSHIIVLWDLVMILRCLLLVMHWLKSGPR